MRCLKAFGERTLQEIQTAKFPKNQIRIAFMNLFSAFGKAKIVCVT